jgi:hypothetical protein
VQQAGKLFLSTEGSSGGAVQVVKTGELPPDPPFIAGVEYEGNPLGRVLEQNYPNPFNPTTTIRFTIVDRQLTIVKVYDILGQEVATLADEVKQPGTHAVRFDGSHLASGMYFCRMTAGDHVDSRSMLLIR